MNSWNSTASCEEVTYIVPFHQCDFVRDVVDCQNNASLVKYLEFLYCTPDNTSSGPVPVIELLVALVALFLLLGTTAGEYLCPALLTISRTLKMNQNVAGVTLLAFGNAAADIVSTIAGVGQNRSSLVIGELYGGALYICTAVIGLLVLMNNFEIPKSLLCDIIFYLSGSIWAFYLFQRGHVELIDSIGFLILYVIYLLVAVVSPAVFRKIGNSKMFTNVRSQGTFTTSDDGYSSDERRDRLLYEPITIAPPVFCAKSSRRFSSSFSLHRHFENAICTLTINVDRELRGNSNYLQDNNAIAPRSGKNSLQEPSLMHPPRCSSSKASFFVGSLSCQESTSLLGSGVVHVHPTQFLFPKTYSEWEELILRLWPVQTEDWREMFWPAKLYHVIVFPLILPLVLTIPVIDEHHRRSNWNRPLNVFQCVAFPIVVLALTKTITCVVHGVPAWTLALIAGCLLGMIVLGSSTNEKPPTYFNAFAFLGFFISLIWIYRLATEVVSILKAFGIYFTISEEVLGASLLTWGNYLGDLVTNLSVASQGYPEMALKACLSASLVALLVGFGTAFTTKFLSNGDFALNSSVRVHSSGVLNAIYISLLASMTLLTIGTFASRFQSKKKMGVVLLTFYALFLIGIFAKEFGLLNLMSSQY